MCRDCSHFKLAAADTEGKEVDGFCRRYPPTRVTIPVATLTRNSMRPGQTEAQHQIGVDSGFPSVQADWSCGEFQHRTQH